MRRRWYLFVLVLAILLGLPANAVAAPPATGHFPSQYLLPGTGVVLMDRGRLVWNIDPETGETVEDPVFEAGPHPSLHGDFGELCAV